MREYVETWGWDATGVLEVNVFDCEGFDHGFDRLLGCRAEVFPGEFGIRLLEGGDQAVFVGRLAPCLCDRSSRAVFVC